MIFVVENESPLLRLMVWGLREEGYEAMSVPMPSEAPRFGEQVPTHVVINCETTADHCARLVQDIRDAVSGVAVLDLGRHEDAACGADHHLLPPYSVGEVIAWLGASAEPAVR